MSERKELLWRLAALLWLATAGWLITLVAAIIAIPVAIIDVLVVLVRGTGLSDGRVVSFVKDAIMWDARMGIFFLTGTGEFELLP